MAVTVAFVIKYSRGNRGTALLAPLNESSWFLSPPFFPPLFFIKTNMVTVVVKKLVFKWRGNEGMKGLVDCTRALYIRRREKYPSGLPISRFRGR